MISTAIGLISSTAHCTVPVFTMVYRPCSTTARAYTYLIRATWNMSTRYVYAYLHGMFSGPHSHKGRLLGEYFRRHGAHLYTPNLNTAQASPLSMSAAMEELHAFYQERRMQDVKPEQGNLKLRIVGSSYGGIIAARFAHLHPSSVDSLVLLSPSFDMLANMPRFFGEKGFEAYKRTGSIRMQTRLRPEGAEVSESGWYPALLPYSLAEDCQSHPAYPVVTCPTHIIHASKDIVVPPELSLKYVDEHRKQFGANDSHGQPWQIQREVVDDVHELATSASVARICAVTSDMWMIGSTDSIVTTDTRES
eukprot:scpid71513/ scgid18256/ 